MSDTVTIPADVAKKLASLLRDQRWLGLMPECLEWADILHPEPHAMAIAAARALRDYDDDMGALDARYAADRVLTVVRNHIANVSTDGETTPHYRARVLSLFEGCDR